MIVLFDASVLIASFVASHSRHKAAAAWLRKAHSKQISLVISSHSLAECYAVLTKLPLMPKISPGIAEHLIVENIHKWAKIVSLSDAQYFSVIRHIAKLGLTGGIVYDAIILKVAEITKVTHLVTLNPKDFNRLCPGKTDFIVEP